MRMHNGAENPLFEARQVIIDILEYNKLGECRFYKDNKKNEVFFQIQSGVKLPPRDSD